MVEASPNFLELSSAYRPDAVKPSQMREDVSDLVPVAVREVDLDNVTTVERVSDGRIEAYKPLLNLVTANKAEKESEKKPKKRGLVRFIKDNLSDKKFTTWDIVIISGIAAIVAAVLAGTYAISAQVFGATVVISFLMKYLVLPVTKFLWGKLQGVLITLGLNWFKKMSEKRAKKKEKQKKTE